VSSEAARARFNEPTNCKQESEMGMTSDYSAVEPARESIDLLDGPALIEFGTPWCGYCRSAQPLLASAMASHPTVRHIKIEDGRGRRLGRSFSVKLWPTLIFLSNGREVARLVRPNGAAAIGEALARIDSAD
jgi:thioredoxin 1